MSSPPQRSNRSFSQLVAQIVSAAGFGLMIVGFVLLLLQGDAASYPGPSAVPLGQLLQVTSVPPALLLVSAGIVLLALLPAMRVLLKLVASVRQRNTITILAAIIVLAELLFSMRGG